MSTDNETHDTETEDVLDLSPFLPPQTEMTETDAEIQEENPPPTESDLKKERFHQEIPYFRKWHEEVKTTQDRIDYLKEWKSELGKEIKELQDALKKLILKGPETMVGRPLLDLAEAGETGEAAEVRSSGSDESNDAWRKWYVIDHFDLTEKEQKLIEQAEMFAGRDEHSFLTIGELAVFLEAVERGDKVKGFGAAKLEKLKEQFEQFWASDDYQSLQYHDKKEADAEESEEEEEPDEECEEVDFDEESLFD